MIYVIRRLLPSIGDAICMEPLISLSHEVLCHEKDAEIWFQCDKRIADFFLNHPFISRILTPKEQIPPGAHIILDIQTAGDCPSIQSLMLGLKRNAVELFCQRANLPGLVYDGRAPRLYFSNQEKERIEFLRRSFPQKKIAIQYQSAHHWKNYPYIPELLNLFLKEDFHIFVTHDDEVSFNKQINTLIRLPYRDLMVWLGAMDLVIGHDSGITHLAAAIGTRTYGIFGPTDPSKILGMYGSHVSWNKFGAWKCPRLRCWLRTCQDVICLKALAPQKIFKDAKRILAEAYQNPRLRYRIENTQSAKIIPMPATRTKEYPQPAIMRLDGLGGTVTMSDHAKKLYELTGKKVIIVSREYKILFEDNPHVERVINVGMRDWGECSLVMRNQFEALAEIRFGIGKWHNKNGYFPQDLGELNQLFDQFPKDFKQLERYGLHHILLTDKTLNLPYNTIESKVYGDEKFDGIEDDFILINNGVDIIHGKMRQTKCWDGWDELIPLLPLKTVQVGTLNDPAVEGAVDLRGQTSLKQLIYLLKKAKKIVTTEGGIAHLAFAAGSQNVIVLGGPTQGVLFEYPGHKWINSYVCGNCWSETNDWYEKCSKDCDAVCMKTITAQHVADVVLG